MKVNRWYERVETIGCPRKNEQSRNALVADCAQQTPIAWRSKNQSCQRPKSSTEHVSVEIGCLRVTTNIIVLSKLYADAEYRSEQDSGEKPCHRSHACKRQRAEKAEGHIKKNVR